VLTRLLTIAPGETLVVVRLDRRLVSSVSHLLAVIEQLEAHGARTTAPHGMLSLQLLGAVDRALIAERTKSGLSVAMLCLAVDPQPQFSAAAADKHRRSQRRTAPLFVQTGPQCAQIGWLAQFPLAPQYALEPFRNNQQQPAAMTATASCAGNLVASIEGLFPFGWSQPSWPPARFRADGAAVQ
jgi:hypothetical protein